MMLFGTPRVIHGNSSATHQEWILWFITTAEWDVGMLMIACVVSSRGAALLPLYGLSRQRFKSVFTAIP
jgi:hypothetical protein